MKWAEGVATIGRDEVDAVLLTPTGDAAILGRFTGTLSLGATTLTSGSAGAATSGLVARFGRNGTPLSAFAFGGAASIGTTAIVRDGSDNLYVAGTFTGIADFGGTQRTSAGGSDGFVARFNAAGGLSWVTTFGNTGNDAVRGLAITADNNLAIAGNFIGAVALGAFTLDAGPSSDALVAKLNSANGAAIWARQDGIPPSNEIAFQIAADPSGSVYVAGRYTGATTIQSRVFANAGGQDGYVGKLTGDGAPLWVVAFGGAGNDQATSLVVRSDHSLVVAGSFTGTMTLPNNTTLSGSGGVDAFVLGLSQLGAQSFAQAIGGSDNEGTAAVIAGDAADALVIAMTIGISGAVVAGHSLGGSGGLDLALVAVGPTGIPTWARSFGGSGDDRFLSIAAHSGAVLVGGVTSSPSLQIGETMLAGLGSDDGVLTYFDISGL